MKWLHVYTEEPSAKIIFDTLLPKILPTDVFFSVYSHQGKQDLEKALRKTLPSISKIPGSRILITRDQDSGDCKDVKKKLDDIILGNCSCPYKIRIVCTELESWFLGDLAAIENAYPRFRAGVYSTKADLRNVDSIVTPNNYLLKAIPEYSGKETLPKLETAENISKFMSLEFNKSTSFNFTISAIYQLIA